MLPSQLCSVDQPKHLTAPKHCRPKSPYFFSQDFAFSTFSVWLHGGWHWIGTAESVLCHFKQGHTNLSLAHRSAHSSAGLHFQTAVWWVPRLSSIPPFLIPAELFASRYCHPEAVPIICNSASCMLLLPTSPSASTWRACLFPRQVWHIWLASWQSPFTYFWKGSLWMILYDCMVSKNHNHQMGWMQIPALLYPPAIVPVHAASFLKSRPLVP